MKFIQNLVCAADATSYGSTAYKGVMCTLAHNTPAEWAIIAFCVILGYALGIGTGRLKNEESVKWIAVRASFIATVVLAALTVAIWYEDYGTSTVLSTFAAAIFVGLLTFFKANYVWKKLGLPEDESLKK